MTPRDTKPASDLGEQATRLAEQLGRMAGTIEGTAEAWLNRQQLASQLTRVRDGASDMLKSLGGGLSSRRAKPKRRPAKPATAGARKTDPSHAPGKRRRKPAPSMRGVKKSSQAIPKMRGAKQARQRRKTYA